MDYWFWDDRAVIVCAEYLMWFTARGRYWPPGKPALGQAFADYEANGPWFPDLPARVATELAAAVAAKQAGVPAPVVPPHPYRPAAGAVTEWEYFGREGVRFEGDHLLWYEREGSERYASGGACEQTFADFVATGIWIERVPADVAAALAAAVTARLAGGSTS
ncbi:hypothetical protein [Limnoglobus roseus]|uniref:Uncharacterized protein n=1 Tax=Limnoglobus roseus TaxID=2598579 RepID=A0A5C1AVS6_9BACT|nr:hypothetical protein [Limnoglobus roseus]QEL20908.1 hypothetical protein PX52LOC_08030 [Limnoglobus roseus]